VSTPQPRWPRRGHKSWSWRRWPQASVQGAERSRGGGPASARPGLPASRPPGLAPHSPSAARRPAPPLRPSPGQSRRRRPPYLLLSVTRAVPPLLVGFLLLLLLLEGLRLDVFDFLQLLGRLSHGGSRRPGPRLPDPSHLAAQVVTASAQGKQEALALRRKGALSPPREGCGGAAAARRAGGAARLPGPPDGSSRRGRSSLAGARDGLWARPAARSLRLPPSPAAAAAAAAAAARGAGAGAGAGRRLVLRRAASGPGGAGSGSSRRRARGQRAAWARPARRGWARSAPALVQGGRRAVGRGPAGLPLTAVPPPSGRGNKARSSAPS
jgi:hypothetical protein